MRRWGAVVPYFGGVEHGKSLDLKIIRKELSAEKEFLLSYCRLQAFFSVQSRGMDD